MALQESTVANTTADSNQPADGPIFDSLTIVEINNKITSQSEAGKYQAAFKYEVVKPNDKYRIIQSDNSRVNLNAVIGAIEKRGYSVNYDIKKARAGRNDRVSIKVSFA